MHHATDFNDKLDQLELTQSAFARKYGVSRSTVHRWCNGSPMPDWPNAALDDCLIHQRFVDDLLSALNRQEADKEQVY